METKQVTLYKKPQKNILIDNFHLKGIFILE
jgi:hypothetical protein